ncbi:helix-turn-helix domain-containing protein [Planctomycetota bacterium]|nr:helix-turn-helix domain-containing protein [Planctomycetota bacterium]
MEATGGRKSEAAELLGMNRRTLYRRDERIADGRDTPD